MEQTRRKQSKIAPLKSYQHQITLFLPKISLIKKFIFLYVSKNDKDFSYFLVQGICTMITC